MHRKDDTYGVRVQTLATIRMHAGMAKERDVLRRVKPPTANYFHHILSPPSVLFLSMSKPQQGLPEI
eukprot:scaffold7207_cov520-Prasinococcus_capsulatus_cf.AAC.2